ncbi:MAG: glutamine-hydrolyzing carbamoyl-phosphate synthase small subunit [Thermodesulfobacteriota bacterium]|nr:glutamine-hydrolyzing carbamoyl-phosphate synthase small subunit [Thermodesulfobacteriota bacterium]
MVTKLKAMLILEDGTAYYGRTFAGRGEIYGEVVFNTSMTGYQEILTDPSYKGQILTMTYPLIGNYGINSEDLESNGIQVEAFVVKEYDPAPSNWRSRKTLADYLNQSGKIGIEGIDTRALTRHIRQKGAMKGVISTDDLDLGSLTKKVVSSKGLLGRDLVREVTCKESHKWDQVKNPKFHVVAFDFGIKFNIIKSLVSRGCNVTIVPAHSKIEEINALKPDGILLSNGPGDPEPIKYAVHTIQNLAEQYPIFGICLGHQLLGLAFGGKSFKLKFGHRGANHPVKNLVTGKVEITTQNHGFCLDIESITDPDIEITHINLNDQTLEGMKHKYLPIFSVQYHPEASPGPHDSNYLFDDFIKIMKEKKA